MSMLKKVGFGVGAAIGVTLVGYLGFKGFKKLRGKKEDKNEFKVFEGVLSKEDFKKRIEEDEKLIKDLENLHYDEKIIEPFRETLKRKKEFFATLKD